MVRSFSRWLGALITVIAASTPAALAQDGGEIARNAVQAMQRITNSTQDGIQTAATHGVRVIQQLDADGAPDRQLIAAAERAQGAINMEARQGGRHINLVAARAFEALRQIRADRRFFVIVHDAKDASVEAIGQARRRGAAAVQTALDEALGG